MLGEKRRMIQAGRVGVLTIATGAVAIGLIFFAMVSLASYLDEKLQDLSEQYALDITDQLGAQTAQSVAATKRAVESYTVETDDPQRLVPSLAALCENMGFTAAAFLNMDGVGVYDDGSPAYVDDFGVPDTALGRAQAGRSEYYEDESGSFSQIGQTPLYLDGRQVGALYVEIPIKVFCPVVAHQRDSYTKYYFIFDQETGQVLDTDVLSTMLPSIGASVYDFIEESVEAKRNAGAFNTEGTSETAVESVEEVAYAVSQKYEAIVVAAIDDVEYFICMSPIGDGSWYMGNIIRVDDVRADASIVSSVLGVVFALVVVCIILSLVVAVLLYRRESQNRADEMKQHLFEALSDSLDFGVSIYCPADGTSTYIVAKTADIFGVPFDEVIRNPQRAVDLKMSAQGRALFLELRDGIIDSTVMRGTFSFVEPHSKRERYVDYVVRPLRYEDKDQLLVLFRDVSASKTIEMSMKDAMQAADSANRAKSEFLMRMSHEIRTPMNVILGKLAIARKHLDEPDRLRKNLTDIDEAAEHLLELINEILDISKIESGKANYIDAPFRPCDLVIEMETMFEPQCAAKNQTFSCTTEGPADEALMGDVMRLRQVLMNLLSNAVKYTQDGGKIEFDTRVSNCHTAGYRTLTFTVKDNGIGMTKDYIDHLYEPFEQEGRLRAEGTGLGMPIVKNIVNSMGGGIHVESQINKGTVFTVVLNKRLASDAESDKALSEASDAANGAPLEGCEPTSGPIVGGNGSHAESEDGKPSAAKPDGTTLTPTEKVLDGTYLKSDEEAARAYAELQAETLPDADAYDFSQIRVLLVEDSELNAEIATELLGDAGVAVDWAEDGEIGFRMFEGSPEGFYDVVLMDIRMPNMNGYDAARAIRTSGHPDAPDVAIIAMSANAFADDILASLKSGMNAHLTKPIVIKNVLATIAVELEKTDNARLKRKS